MAQKDDSSSLSEEQLRKLAKVMYYKGAQAIHTMNFRSEFERARYLKCCKDTYFNTLDLINTTESATNEFDDDHLMAPIVKTYAGYIKKAIWLANKSIQAYSKRAEHITWLKEHAASVLKVLREHKISPLNEARLAQFAEDIAVLSKNMLKYEAQAASPRARKLYRVVRTSGYTFQKLLRRYQTVLGYKGPFKKLGTEQQLQVIDKVIEATGGRKLLKYGKRSIEVLDKYGGKAVYGLTALVAAIDIYSADPDKRYETAVKSVVTIGSSLLIGELQGLIYIEVAFALICTGNPAFIALGIAIGVGTYFAGNAIQDFIDNKVAPVVVDFMNNHRKEVEEVALGIVTFSPLVAILEATGVLPHHTVAHLLKDGFEFVHDQVSTGLSVYEDIASKNPTLAVLVEMSGPVGMLLGLFRAASKPRPSAESNLPLPPPPPPPISTYGIRVRGPQVPDGRIVALQIASKA